MIPLRLVGFVVCAAVVFMFFYTPVPDGMASDDQWLLRKISALSKIGRLAGRIGSAVGYDSPINITRAIRNSRIAFVHPDTLTAVSTHHDFDGVNVTIHEKVPWTKGKPLRAALVYLHGGGWVYEYQELYAHLERYLADRSELTVVSVDYPLAPENPYPKPFEACLDSILYLHKHAEKFGIDADMISVAGDSAGGNLAAAVTLKLRDMGKSIIQRQILISPALQFATFRTESYEHNDFPVLDRQTMIKYWLYYLHESLQFLNELTSNEHLSRTFLKGTIWPYLQKYQKFPQDHVKLDEKVLKRWEKRLKDPYLCPLLAEDLSGLPPTLVLASEFDILRDEALAYADRMKDAGVDVTLKKTAGFHGVYCFFRDSKVGKGMLDSIVDFVKNSAEAKNVKQDSKRL